MATRREVEASIFRSLRKSRDAGEEEYRVKRSMEERAMINSSLCFGGPLAAWVWRLQALRGST